MTDSFSAVLAAHARRYPRMLPQDYGKLAYQSEFGPAHLRDLPGSVQADLEAEWDALPDSLSPRPPEDIGNGLCRLHLYRPAPPGEAALLARLCLRTAGEHHGTRAGLEDRLEALAGLPVSGMGDWLAEYRRRGCPPLRHSPAFRAAYRPHYRLLRTEYGGFLPVLSAVQALLEGGRPALVAIDGRCGSGKTRLADLMGSLFPINVIHTDDFYLPFPDRAADWTETPGGNLDFPRLLREGILPAAAGAPLSLRPFDCRTGVLLPPVARPPAAVTVVEGSYSLHPALEGRWDLTVFLTCSPEVQQRRLRQREGAGFSAFRDRWIPMEERYFQRCGTPARADLTVDTSSFFPSAPDGPASNSSP